MWVGKSIVGILQLESQSLGDLGKSNLGGELQGQRSWGFLKDKKATLGQVTKDTVC